MTRPRERLARVRVCFAALVALAGAVEARVAGAQSVTAEAEREAVSLAQQGIAARRAGRDVEALAAFDRSLALAPRASVQAQRGFALQALGRWIDAERALDAVARDDDPWVRRHRATIDGALAAVRSHLGWLELSVEPARSEVLVDGVAAVAGAPVRLPAGAVSVVARCEGHYGVERSVVVRAEETAREAIVLRPRVDETPAVTAPPVVVAPVAAPVVVAPPPRDDARVRWIGPTALAGAGVVSLGVGIGLWVLRENTLGTLSSRGCVETDAEFVCDARRTDVTAARALHDDASRESTASTATLLVGGALVVAGAGWMLAEVLRHNTSRERAGITLTPGGVRWTF